MYRPIVLGLFTYSNHLRTAVCGPVRPDKEANNSDQAAHQHARMDVQGPVTPFCLLTTTAL